MSVRRAEPFDAAVLALVLNEIIALGGTTAHVAPFSDGYFRDHDIDGPDAACCHLAEMEGQVLGFQALGCYPALPESWLDVGTVVRRAGRGRGGDVCGDLCRGTGKGVQGHQCHDPGG